MRSKLTTAAVTLVAVFAFSAVAVASASAHEFIASKTGTFTGKTNHTITFGTPTGLGECTSPKSSVTGKITALKSKAIIETVQPQGCEYWPYVVTFSPGEFEITAEGKARLLKKVTVENEFGQCKESFTPRAQEVGTVTYKNSSPIKTLTVERASKLMNFTGTGGVCGDENLEGEWTEGLTFTLEGGTLAWE
jgi:hypothetical protein